MNLKYGQLCDAVARIFYSEEFGIPSYEENGIEGISHTSSKCRKAALAVFDALEVEGDNR